MIVTLNDIREHSPCKESWEKLLNHLGKTNPDNEPLELKVILDLLGVEDAIWALRALKDKDKEIRLFACDCAESVLHIYEDKYPNDTRVRDCIEAARKYAVGEIDLDLLIEARAAAWGAAWAAWGAAWGAAWAVRAAARDVRAAADAARDAAREKQEELFIKYFCND